MKKGIIVILSLFFIMSSVAASTNMNGISRIYRKVIDGDTVMFVELQPVYILKSPIDTKRYARLIYNLKVVYPIAKDARKTLDEIEAKLLSIKGRRQQEAYVKAMEKFLKNKYTPVLRRMTFAQGKILIKLIDRETNHSSYDLVKRLRGGFSAFFWQSIARIFGANLKDKYDRDGEDKMIERLIILYEAGLL